MKKLMTAMLGLSLLGGLATVSFAAQEKKDEAKKEKKAKKPKKAKKTKEEKKQG